MNNKVLMIMLFVLNSAVFAANPFDGISGCQQDFRFFTKQKFIYLSDKSSNLSKNSTRTGCLVVPNKKNHRICMTVPLDTVNVPELKYTISYKVHGKVTLTWTIYDLWLADPTSMTVETADLGGDGIYETVLNVLNEVSNGLGIGYSTLYIIAPDGKSIIGSKEVQDYGIISGIYHVPGRIGCVLLVSKWQRGYEPKRGQGLYAVGHWYVVAHGSLAPYGGLPSMRRRFLDSFGEERSQLKTIPLLWFKSRLTEILNSTQEPTQ
jgi:hypothetical protein